MILKKNYLVYQFIFLKSLHRNILIGSTQEALHLKTLMKVSCLINSIPLSNLMILTNCLNSFKELGMAFFISTETNTVNGKKGFMLDLS